MIAKLIEKKKYITYSNLTFQVNSYGSKIQAEELVEGKEYEFKPKEVKSKRSIEQNKFMWKCLELIAEKELGRTY